MPRSLARALNALAFLVSSALLVAAAPVAAQVTTLDQWGTYATIVSSDCADACDPETDLGWHIIRLADKRGILPFEEMERQLRLTRGLVESYAETLIAKGLLSRDEVEHALRRAENAATRPAPKL